MIKFRDMYKRSFPSSWKISIVATEIDGSNPISINFSTECLTKFDNNLVAPISMNLCFALSITDALEVTKFTFEVFFFRIFDFITLMSPSNIKITSLNGYKKINKSSYARVRLELCRCEEEIFS